MSLVLRLRHGLGQLGLVTGSLTIAVPRLHKLPSLVDFLPKQWAKQNSGSKDHRLEELKERLNQNSEPPFMIDNGTILKAVPKKKPSYRRTREKLYSPGDKQIQPLKNLGRCAACGRVKRSHFMCMHCFAEIRTFLKEKKKALLGPVERQLPELNPIDEKIIYPGKYKTDHEERLRRKEWIPKREEPLMYKPSQVKKE